MAKNTDYCRGTGFQFSGSSFCYFFAVFVFVYTLSYGNVIFLLGLGQHLMIREAMWHTVIKVCILEKKKKR